MMDSVFRPCWYGTAAWYIHSDIKKLSESEFFARKRAISMYGCESWTIKKAEHRRRF